MLDQNLWWRSASAGNWRWINPCNHPRLPILGRCYRAQSAPAAPLQHVRCQKQQCDSPRL